MKAKIIIAAIVALFLMLGCTDVEKTIDDDLRFAINTSPHSNGLSSYRLPLSNQLDKIPQDPRNRLTEQKIKLGQLLFHEAGFATKGNFSEMEQTYSCASCHHAAGGFQANLLQGVGDGGIGFGLSGEGRQIDLFIELSKVDVQPLRTPSAMNIAYQTNVLWNGQFGATALNEGTESLWAEDTPIATNRLGYEGTEIQAIAGLEVHRHDINESSITSLGYKAMFDQVFFDFDSEERYSNVTAGLAIAAYERTILSYDAPFQRWLRGGSQWMSVSQKEGAILFFTKGQCNSCHNGPSLAAMDFQAIGLNDFDPALVVNFETSDESRKGRGSFTKNSEDDYKFKIPQLYNLKDSPFYGHGASFHSVRDLIAYKNIAEPENRSVPDSQLSSEFHPLDLTEEEIDLITDFVENALYDPTLDRYLPTNVLSGMCFPNNDWKSREDIGCE